MKRTIIILYGIIAYLFFLVAFLYAIGFVGNFIVPKSIDSGVEITLLHSITINSLLLCVFAIQHSVMARPTFKKWFTKYINSEIERSTYVLSSSLALLLIYWKWKPMKYVIWEVENDIIVYILTGVFIIGWLMVFISSFIINHFELFGLQQTFKNFKDRKPKNSKFQVTYLYKIIRHPMMLGFLIAFWSTPIMTSGHLMFALLTTLYILVAVKCLEEKELRRLIGKDYEDYERKVPMIFPLTKMIK